MDRPTNVEPPTHSHAWARFGVGVLTKKTGVCGCREAYVFNAATPLLYYVDNFFSFISTV
jgi:hypothetical protein